MNILKFLPLIFSLIFIKFTLAGDFHPPPQYNQVPQSFFEYRKYLKLAKKGDALAQYKICLAYSFAEYTTYNPDKAIFWCEKSAQQSYAEAQSWLGFMYMDRLSYERHDYDKALYWLKLASAQNDPYAYYYLGKMYDYGLAVKPSLQTAVSYYQLAIESGIFWAQQDLTKIQTKYQNFERDLLRLKNNKNNKKLLASLMQDLSFSCLAIYQSHAVSHKECINAVDWLIKSAEYGSLIAREYLGEFYFYGKHVAQDYSQAMYWLKLAIEQNNYSRYSSAEMYLVGLMYEQGLGVDPDLDAALYWYKLATISTDAKNAAKRIYKQQGFWLKSLLFRAM